MFFVIFPVKSSADMSIGPRAVFTDVSVRKKTYSLFREKILYSGDGPSIDIQGLLRRFMPAEKNRPLDPFSL